MLNDNLLGNKLDSYKNQKFNSMKQMEEKPQVSTPPNITQAVNGFVFVLRSFIFLFRSFILGFALKTIFSTDWTIFSLFCVGFSLNYIINTIAVFFNKEI